MHRRGLKPALIKALQLLWLPLFLLLGVTWLLAPALAHEHYGTLRLISTEEAEQIAYGWLFRTADVVAALLIIVGVYVFGVLHRSRLIGAALLLIAVLSAMDGLFPDTCYLGHVPCSTTASVFATVHDIETLILVLAIGVVSVGDAIKNRRTASIYFIAFQVLIGLVFLLTGVRSQLSIVLQYTYEFGVISWLAWLVGRFSPPLFVGKASGAWLRRLFGFWTLMGGIFLIVVAASHVHSVPHLAVVSGLGFSLIEQHGIIAGVLMIYVARHILRGERPAVWLLLLLFASQVIVYSVLAPQPVLMILSLVPFILLIQFRYAFYRHTESPAMLSRFKDAGIVLCGVLVALAMVLAVATATGRRSQLLHDAGHMYGHAPYHATIQKSGGMFEAHEARLRVEAQTLLLATGVIVLWSLFRPKSWRHLPLGTIDQRLQMHALLAESSDNSEDFFKIWPEDKHYFLDPVSGGMVAYRVVGATAFALSDPIAQTFSKRQATLRAFLQFVRGSGWTACFLLVPDTSTALYEEGSLKVLPIGSSAVIDIRQFVDETARSKWWRWQRNRARRNGWQYQQLAHPHTTRTLRQLQEVSDDWLGREGRREQGFALGYFDFDYLQQCRLHILKDSSNHVVAFANELPVFHDISRASVDLIRFRPGEDGAMPTLLMELIEHLPASQYQTFDLGFVPLAGLDTNLVRISRTLGANRFGAAGLEQFKNKFKPTWHHNYVAYDGDMIDLARAAANLERLFAVDKI